MLSALQNMFFLAAELCVLLIVPAYAKKVCGALFYCMDNLPVRFVFSPYSDCLPLFDDPF